MSAPLVSVIVPAYQAERFIEETLDSAANQDYPAVEVIVVDDGSTDRTAVFAAGRDVRVLQQPHRGPAAARNTGLAAAAGEFIAVLDADDLWPSDRLSLQVDFLERNRELGLVLGLTDVFLNPGEEPPAHWFGLTHGKPIAAVAGTMLVRREVFATVGTYDESLWKCEDIEWLARVKDAGIAAGALDRVVLRYRIHAANTSRDTEANKAVLLRVLRDSVRRQREAKTG
ncbi:MAG TPA: glycosyltransferase family A protein [Solirubrobacteraceae bacterium]|nr:glycosyltransferase family A protein [Solirubrobacteraceae bacterium]